MNNESRTRRRAAPAGFFAILFLVGTAFVARATVLAEPHQTLNGIAGLDTHGIVAAWTSNHNGNHYTVDVTWGDATPNTSGQVSSNGHKSFDVQGTHVYAAPGTYFGNALVVDLVDASSANISFTAEIRPTGLIPMALSLDDSANANSDSDVDGVFEFGETVVLNPSWSTATENLSKVTGTLSDFHRVGQTAGENYSLTGPGNKETADYGSIAKNDTHDCFNGNDTPECYTLTATLSGPRPNPHMDAVVTETLTGNVVKTWTLHLGGSFTDVPVNSLFYGNIETIFHNGVTTGCTTSTFCPRQIVTRYQMAAFIARGLAGGDANVPTSGTVDAQSYNCVAGATGQSLFTDVAKNDPFCRHIHYIASKAITLGCGGTNFCPWFNLPRQEAATFIARSQPPNNPGTEGDVPMAYTDPVTARSYDCNIATADVPFSDVPATHPFCKYIGYVWAKGIVDGYANGTFGPANLMTREQMAKMLDRGLALTLYHP